MGVSDALPKSIVYRMLKPVFEFEEGVRVIAREDRSTEDFIAELPVHAVDVVLSDAPAGSSTSVRAFSHPLGECGTTFFAAPAIAEACSPGFPASLADTPLLLPGSHASLRRTLDLWLDAMGIRPEVAAEIDDPALAKVLGEAGLGVFAVPNVIEAEVLERYNVKVVGRVEALRQAFYVISLERKVMHPAVVAICETARKHIFA